MAEKKEPLQTWQCDCRRAITEIAIENRQYNKFKNAAISATPLNVDLKGNACSLVEIVSYDKVLTKDGKATERKGLCREIVMVPFKYCPNCGKKL